MTEAAITEQTTHHSGMAQDGHVINEIPPNTDINDSADSGVKMELEKDHEQSSSTEKLPIILGDNSVLDGEKPEDALLRQTAQKGANDTVINLDSQDKYYVQTETHRKDPKCWTKCVQCLKRHEYLVLILGCVTFLLGCIVLIIGVYMVQSRASCPSQPSTMAPSSHHSPLVQSSLATASPGVGDHLSHPTTSLGSTVNNTSHHTQTQVTTTTTEPLILGDNIALGRSAFQSTTYVQYKQHYRASLATDGSTEHQFSGGSCSRTAIEERPHWFVDLGNLQVVKTVKIFIPRDIPAGELHNFEVRIGQSDSELETNPLCRYYMGTALTFSVTVRCERPLYGRIVSIELLGDDTRPKNRLTLCEVEVYN